MKCFKTVEQYGISLFSPKDEAICDHLHTLFTPFNRLLWSSFMLVLSLFVLSFFGHLFSQNG